MALQGTSAPQGLMALLAALPPTSPANTTSAGALGLMSDETGAGFSSLLQSLMSGTEAPASLLPQAQSLPLSVQPELNSMPLLPPTELETPAQENTESVLAQLHFGTLQLRPNATCKAPSSLPSEQPRDESETDGDSALTLLALALPLDGVPMPNQEAASNTAPNAAQSAVQNTAQSTGEPSALALSPARPQQGGELAATVPSEPDPSAQGDAPVRDFRADLSPSKDSNLSANGALPSMSQSPASPVSAGQDPMLASAAPSHIAPSAVAPTPSAAPVTAQASPNQAAFASTQEKMTLGDDSETGVKLGSRILMMVADGVHKARIQLDPPELGSLEIKMHVQQDQASVQVHAATPQVRDALEASAARLRDALASQGLELQHFSVSSGQAGQGQGGQSQAEDEGTSAEGEWQAEDDRIETPKTTSLNLLDTFA
jgi:flagellar hook-length control protein FliK